MKKLSAVLVLVAAAALLTSVTALAATKVSKFKVGYTTKKAAASSGLAFDISFRDPAASVPQGLQSFAITLARGSKFDLRGSPSCVASNEELEQLGSKACPANTRIGSGSATATDGIAPVTVDSKIFNLEPLKKPKDPSTGEILFTFDINDTTVASFAAKAQGRKMSVSGLTGALPGSLVVTDFSGKIDKHKKGKRRLLTTPGKCPAKEKWAINGVFRFADGASKPKTTSRCSR